MALDSARRRVLLYGGSGLCFHRLRYARVPSLTGRFIHRLQSRVRGSVKNLSHWVETGTVTRTIPGLLFRVPVDNATKVRADSRKLVQAPFGIPVSRDFLKPIPNYRSCT